MPNNVYIHCITCIKKCPKRLIAIYNVENKRYTFYKFDVNTLALKGSFIIDVVGEIDISTTSDGKVAIKATEEDVQNNYIFNINNGLLEHTKQEHTKNAESIIQEQIDINYSVQGFMQTPSKMGALVMIYGNDNSRVLWLYGMEDPKTPVREYAIFRGNQNDSITNIEFLGNGVISYVHHNSEDLNKKHFVTYDYFKKQIVKEHFEGIETDIDMEKLKGILEEKVKGSIVDFKTTPSYMGAIVLSQTENGTQNIALFGLEDINNPLFEKNILGSGSSTGYKGKVALDAELLGGILKYSMGDTNKVAITYDYFNDKYIKYETDAQGEEAVDLLLRAKTFSEFKIWSFGVFPGEPYIEYLEGSKYIVTYGYSSMDFRIVTAIFDIADTSEHRLTVLREGPGGPEAKNITIDRENYLVRYTTRMSYYDVPAGKSSEDYDLNANILHTYNYRTDESNAILPKK